jgi:3-deoxy-manno-octulosonate cytidylyltransferase (CMP-KDO synthetase)
MENKKRPQSTIVFIAIGITIALTAGALLLLNGGMVTTEPAKISDWVSAIVSIFAFMSGLIAVYMAYKNFDLTKRAEEGNLYQTMMRRYASGEMRDALRVLSDFHKSNSVNFETYVKGWYQNRQADDVNTQKVEDARHLVKYFYRDLMQLVQAGYFNKELAKRICNAGGRHVFKNVILPMDKAMNPFFFEGEYDPFDEIYKELEGEQVIKKELKKVCLIPARYDASRFDGKLLKILIDPNKRKEKTVILETYERMASYNLFDEVMVVTNSLEIKNEIEGKGGRVYYSNNMQHESGTDRIAEAIQHIDADIIFNVQGDEPFIDKKPLEDLVVLMSKEPDDMVVASLMKELTDPDNINSADFVKVTCSKSGKAINFSRSITPYPKKQTDLARYYEHVGVYAFTRASLLKFATMPPTVLEKVESIECLRFLENDIPIKMIETNTFLMEIDTEQDLNNVNRLLAQGNISLV